MQSLANHLIFLQLRPQCISALSLADNSVTTLLDGLSGTPDGVVADIAGGYIYFTNMGEDFSAADGSIERCKLDGSEQKLLVGNGQIVTPKQLAMTPDKLYWSDREGLAVWRCNKDGSNLEVLYRSGSVPEDQADQSLHCVGIAVDEANGWFYWTQKGPSSGGVGAIYRAPLDIKQGESPEARSDVECLIDKLPEPIDLFLARNGSIIYWTDRSHEPVSSVNRATLDAKGLTEHKIIASGFQDTIGVVVDKAERFAYVTDLPGKLYKVEIESGKIELMCELSPLTGIDLIE